MLKLSRPALIGLSLLLSSCGSSSSAAHQSVSPASSTTVPTEVQAVEVDPYLWLEDVDGERSLAWVRERNTASQAELESDPGFGPLRQRLLAILDSDARIPTLDRRAAHYYNFWRDASHPRGLWRRTSLAQYRRPNPVWETVLDVDALAAQENENWVWQGAGCLEPNHHLCMISLSRGGGDASVIREFDTRTKRFVDGGFLLPEAKTEVSWQDESTLIVGTDFGPGTLTDSGYARQVRAWTRGTPLGDARLLIEGVNTDVELHGGRSFSAGFSHDWLSVNHTFFTEDGYVKVGEEYVRLDKPADAQWNLWRDQLLLQLRSDWTLGETTYAAGSLLMANLADYLAGQRNFVRVFEPTPTKSLHAYITTASRIMVVELEDVQTRLYVWRNTRGAWTRSPIHSDVTGMQRIAAVDDTSDEYWHWVSDYLTPNTYSIGNGRDRLTQLRQEPSFFDGQGLSVSQHFAASADGTRVPYFQVSRSTPEPGAPTLLYGYGGFEISLTPSYNAMVGAGWLEAGGTYVVANIRGGGEYGPAWHQAAMQHNRQRAYDDFIAVAEDLISRGVTTTSRLGIQGGSNGGLLMGVMLTQRPDLFGAVVCQVPLLDMRRYHLLLAGASWMEEYGNPDVAEDWAALSRFSPYQNLRDGVRYPPTLFMSSTRDDRVHPGHGRKMVAAMMESAQPVLYYENIEGGHGGAANNEQRAHMTALAYTFLRRRLTPAP